MIALKCLVCGGDVEVVDTDKDLYTCLYCGNLVTVPKGLDENENLFNRATHLRQSKRFDKAIEVYEALLNKDDTNAEAHFGVALCRYGIEYVKDSSGEYVPTCGRFQPQSILVDDDYSQAVRHADAGAAGEYTRKAQAIDTILRRISDVQSREQPYDVFICYKDTDDSGQRTPDSLRAREVYDILTAKGYRVFFARKTLESKIGEEYEPYIYAALHSAKVMLLIASKPEYVNAVWVRNEWTRFLDLMKQDRDRRLLPLYFGMTAYDLPEEVSLYQAYDMTKIGFMEDLCDGIAKIMHKPVAAPAVPAGVGSAVTVESLLKRAELYLSDKDWTQANQYYDRVLDINPECAPAYEGKLYAEAQLTGPDQVLRSRQPLTGFVNYARALRFADAPNKARLQSYAKAVAERLAEEQRESDYQTLLDKIGRGRDTLSSAALAELAEALRGYGDYRNAPAKAAECEELVEQAKARETETEYNAALATLRKVGPNTSSADLGALAQRFQRFGDYRDAEAKAAECLHRVTGAKAREYDVKYASVVYQAQAGQFTLSSQALSDLAQTMRGFGDYRDAPAHAAACEQAAQAARAREAAHDAEAAQCDQAIQQVQAQIDASGGKITALNGQLDALFQRVAGRLAAKNKRLSREAIGRAASVVFDGYAAQYASKGRQKYSKRRPILLVLAGLLGAASFVVAIVASGMSGSARTTWAGVEIVAFLLAVAVLIIALPGRVTPDRNLAEYGRLRTEIANVQAGATNLTQQMDELVRRRNELRAR